MHLKELFGFGKKEQPIERGDDQQRAKLADKLLTLYVKMYNKDNALTDKIRKVVGKNALDPISLEQNKIMRHSLIGTIVRSEKSLDELNSLLA